jgi:hypothetical protein
MTTRRRWDTQYTSTKPLLSLADEGRGQGRKGLVRHSRPGQVLGSSKFDRRCAGREAGHHHQLQPQEEDRVPGTRTRLAVVEQGWCRAARRKSSAVLVPSAESQVWAQTDTAKVTRFAEKLAWALGAPLQVFIPAKQIQALTRRAPHWDS